jgi:hypothetical protein
LSARRKGGRDRGRGTKKKPTHPKASLGATGHAPQEPHTALALDGGPRSPREQPRDLVVVLDRNGTILDLHPILGAIFGPLHVLASDVREIIRTAERGPCLVEERSK